MTIKLEIKSKLKGTAMVKILLFITVLFLNLYADNYTDSMEKYKAPPKYEPQKNSHLKTWERSANTQNQPWMQQEIPKKNYNYQNYDNIDSFPQENKEYGFTYEIK